MTITALPINASAGAPTYNARQTRQAFSALMMAGSGQLRTHSGFRPGGDPSVSVTATTWTVGPFSCVIDAGVSAVQAPYLVASDANSTGSVTAADSTFARRDILYVQVSDTDEDSSGARAATVGYLAGTPAATPTAPNTPARSLLAGYIDVPKVGGGNPAYTSAAQYCVAAGGIALTNSQSDRDALPTYKGAAAWRQDQGVLEIWDNGWHPVGVPPLSQIGVAPTHITAPVDGTLVFTRDTRLIYAWNATAATYQALPRGTIARGIRTTSSFTTGTTAIAVLRLDNVPIVSGHLYSIHLSPVQMTSTVGTDTIEADIRVNRTGTATVATAIYTKITDGVGRAKGLSINYSAPASGVLSILLTVVRAAGSGSVSLSADSTIPINLWVNHEGTDPGDTGVQL